MDKLNFLAGPWLWAWYCGIVIGNVWALVTAVYTIFTGGLLLFMFGGVILWPLWVIIVALPVTLVLGILFTVVTVSYKALRSAYDALPFTLNKKGLD